MTTEILRILTIPMTWLGTFSIISCDNTVFLTHMFRSFLCLPYVTTWRDKNMHCLPNNHYGQQILILLLKINKTLAGAILKCHLLLGNQFLIREAVALHPAELLEVKVRYWRICLPWCKSQCKCEPFFTD